MSHTLTVEQYSDQRAADRQARALDRMADAMTEDLEIPPPVTNIDHGGRSGRPPIMGAEAFELARQVYYLQFGSRLDAARAIIEAGLARPGDTETHVAERLKNWWTRHGWPVRSYAAMVALRDANRDGGLYRSDRRCKGLTTGGGKAPAGKPCDSSPLSDSDYCKSHDPRPEYVEMRDREANARWSTRRRSMVDAEPLRCFLVDHAHRLLVEARDRGEAHSNEKTGLRRLCRINGVDQAQLQRFIDGKHHRHPEGLHRIQARTVERYLRGLPATFEELYGHPVPTNIKEGTRCPDCGATMNAQASQCRSCHDAQRARCTYVFKSGDRCRVTTSHESGYCQKCRRTVERVRKPRSEYAYRRSQLLTDGRLLVHMLDEYVRTPSAQWVGAVMWAHGLRGSYNTRKTLVGQIVKVMRDRDDVAAWRDEAIAEHGAPDWPPVVEAIDGVKLVPLAPYVAWLNERLDGRHGSQKALASRIGTDAEQLGTTLRGTKGSMVSRAVVERSLTNYDDGSTFADLYERGVR